MVPQRALPFSNRTSALRPPSASLLLLLTMVAGGALPALAQTPEEAYPPTDTSVVRFVPRSRDPMGTQGEAEAACVGSGKRLITTFQFYMKRAIGDSSTTSPDGRLVWTSNLVSNGVVAKNAELELLIGDLVWQPAGNRPKPPVKAVRISFKINGHDVPEGLASSPTPDPSEIRKLKFPVEFLRFPVKAPPSQQPIERPNTIEVYWNPSDFISPLGWKICGIEQREITLVPRRVRFDAMAPIILIHGNNECPGFFKASGNCTDGKPKLRFDFESVLKAARVPYDLSIDMPADSVDAHAAALGSPAGANSIHRIVRSFGAARCHIIAHSKGGLDSREFLARLPKQGPPSAPLSLITLSTPHKGSPGADYLEMVRRGVIVGSDTLTDARLKATWVTWLTDPYNAAQWSANTDLTTQKGRQYATYKLRLPSSLTIEGKKHELSYYAIISDANANNSSALLPPGPSIEPPEDEGLPTPHWRAASFVYQLMGETRSVLAVRLFPTMLLVAIAEPTNGFRLNDVAVPLWSQSPGDPFVQSSRMFLKNHASVAFPGVATHCLQFIRAIRPLDPSLGSSQ